MEEVDQVEQSEVVVGRLEQLAAQLREQAEAIFGKDQGRKYMGA
jgi:hypothetical protein